MHCSIPRLLAPLATLTLAPAASSGVLVVAQTAGPGIDATSLQVAVGLAAEADTILIRDGIYSPFEVQGKSLVVVADGENVLVRHIPAGSPNEPAIEIRDLAADQSVVIRGVATNLGLLVEDCDGPVWFDDVHVQGAGAVPFCAPAGLHGAEIRNANQVTFTGCTLVGEDGSGSIWSGAEPGMGARVQSANVQLFESSILGGTGSIGFLQDGGTGLQLNGSDVTLVGCAIEGGPGGIQYRLGATVCNGSHGRGGAGIEFVGGASSVSSAATTAVGGAADLGPLCPGQTGPPGVAIKGSGTILPLAGFARFLHVESPVRGANSAQFEAFGQPGELPLVLVSETWTSTPLPAYSGTLLVTLPPTDVLVLPAVPASGPSSLAVPIPSIGPVLGGRTFVAQALFLDGASKLWLGGGSTMTIVDPAY